MEKRIRNYEAYLASICNKEYTAEERQQICSQVLVQIGFFQHERLVHLIVTVTFALLAVIVFGICGICPSVPFLGLEILLLILLIPYIRHYFILENTVQKMYHYYDILRQEEFAADGRIGSDV